MDTKARLTIFAIVEKNHEVIKLEAGAESMCRWTHVILSMSTKDRTVVSTSAKIERMPLT